MFQPFRRWLLAGALALWCLPASAQQQGTSAKMDLVACLSYAFENTAPMVRAGLDMKMAEGRVGEVMADGLPQVSASGQYLYNYQIQKVILPPEANFFGGPPSDEPVALPFGVAMQSNANLSVRQLLFDGSFFLGLRAAKVYQELSRKGLQQTKVEVAAAVTKAYYTVLISQERLLLLEQNLTRVDTLLRQSKLQLDNGFAEVIDVQRVEIVHNNLQTEIKRLKSAIQVSKSLLKFQMGMPLDQPLELADDLATLSAAELALAGDDAPRPENRPEYALLRTQEELDEMNIRQFKVGYFPKLYAIGNYGANTGGNELRNLTRWFSFGAVGLTLDVPIFDGFRKSYQIQQARLRKEKTMVDMVELERRIGLEAQQYRLQLQDAIEALDTQRRNQSLAENVYNVTKIKYQEGIGSSLEVVEAETSYKESITNYYAALYDALIAKVEYEKALGTLID